MGVLTLLAAALSANQPFELRATILYEHVLEVQVVARTTTPTLLTPRTTLGCYLEVDILDTTGARIGHVGRLANCPSRTEADFQVFVSSDTFGSPLFGVDIDLETPERVRLSIDGEEHSGLEKSREYRLVVTYHNDDGRTLAAQRKAALRRSHPGMEAPVILLRTEPIPYRKAS